MKKVLLLLALLVSAQIGCMKKEPVTTAVCPGVIINLPGTWKYEKTEKQGEVKVFLFTRGNLGTIRAAVSPARDIPFTQQIHQDRNTLNTGREYKILLEKNTQIGSWPGYIFISTTVENGERLKVKTIVFQMDRRLIYITLKSEEDSFEKTAADFNEMIEKLKNAGQPVT